MIRVTEPKVSATERANAVVAANRVALPKKQQPEIQRDLRITQTREDDWVDHEVEKGLISYSAQYSDDTFVYRLSTRIFKDVQRILAQRADRLLTREDLSQTLGIPMSNDWKHYHTHTRARVLLFKRIRRDRNDHKMCDTRASIENDRQQK